MFKKAVRTEVYLKLACAGPSGSGKTYSSLVLASALGKLIGSRVALIDTENKSAALYSDKFDFDICDIEAPYSVQKYEAAVRGAIDAGYKVLVIDSISHQWAAEGGILDRKSRMDAGGGNSFTNWAKLTPEQERFRALILHSDIHMICTMRSKTEHVIQQNAQGKNEVVKKGMAPIQRDGMEYEFTTMFDIDMAHQAQTSKDRTGLFDQFHEVLTPAHSKRLFDWMQNAKPAEPKPAPAVTKTEHPYGDMPEPQGEPTQLKPSESSSEAPKCLLAGCGKELTRTQDGNFKCPNAKTRGDGHARVLASSLASYTSQAQKTA